MSNRSEFAARIREKYPEGLTGIFALGGTRTSFILEKNRDQQNPGQIKDFSSYVDYSHQRLLEVMQSFFNMGGQNMVIALFSYQGFYERDDTYVKHMIPACLRLIEADTLMFYQQNDIDPYFVGIDTLLHLPEDHPAYGLGKAFEDFHKSWDYQEGRRKVIWEVAPIPTFSFWKAPEVMGEAANAELKNTLANCTDLYEIHNMLYEYYAWAVYGTYIPIPHFYLGSNRNGNLKLRSMLPIALVCGGPFRLYYTPYPSLFITDETLQAMLEDIAFGAALRSTTVDYKDRFNPEIMEAEYARVQELRDDPDSTLGLTRVILE
jgi:hypothetical protein